METDISNYALIIDENNEVYLVAFHSQTFISTELSYNTYNKKFLAIFKPFKIWYYYLENPAFSINVIIDHKNLEYFSITKILTYRQA